MKRFLMCLALALTICSIGFTRGFPYRTNVKPRLSLAQGLQLAQKALGKDAKYYCFRAELAVTSSPDGELQKAHTPTPRRGRIC